MAKRRTEKLYSLAEVSRKTGISLASLRRYRALHADRIPSQGEGRRQRFPESALVVFETLKQEGMARRGRGRRRSEAAEGAAKGSAAARAAAKRRTGRPGATSRGVRRKGGAGTRRAVRTVGGNRESLLSLVQIGQMTGISYPTLLRYVRLHLGRLPHAGTGRKRRFHPEAVAVFRELREQSRYGRRGGERSAVGAPSVARQLARLERGQRDLARQLRDLKKTLRRPFRIRLER